MTSTDQPTVPPRPRRVRWSRRRAAIASALAVLLVLAGLLAVVLAPGSAPPASDGVTAASDHAAAARESGTSVTVPSDGPAAVTDVTTTVGGASDPTGADAAGDASVPATASAPKLIVDADVYGAPGANGALFRIGNAGGSPLEWSIPQEDSPVPVVDPESGTIAAGQWQLVSFELPSPVLHDDVVYPLTVLSNGGNAHVDVHLDALDPVFEIVDGTWNIRNGDTFLVSYGDMDLGLTVKNVGTSVLHVAPQPVDGLAVIGGPWDLAPGEEAHLHLVLCNASYAGGIPDFHDRGFHIATDGWQATLDFYVRFTLAPAQAALPC